MTCCPAPVVNDINGVPPLLGEEAKPWIAFAGPGTKRIELIVPAAHCAACIMGIEEGLGKIPGVIGARLNLTARRVAVTWRDGEVEPQAFIDCLASLGYASRPFDPRETGFLNDEKEDRALLRALAVAGFAASNVMLLSVSVWSGADPATRDLFHWISALIALPAVVYAGRPFFASAAAALRHGRVNMDVPISLGVILASAMSLFETIRHQEHAFFDAAVTLLFFLLVGRYLDHLMRSRARSAISQLMTMTPSSATIVGEGGDRRLVPASSLARGMTMAVAAGERFAADGVVASGMSDIDRSLVTGETALEPVKAGDEIQAGTLNVTGPLIVTITAAGEDTFLSELIRLMAVAEQGQSAYVRLADRLARFYSPAVHILAASTLLGWLLAGHGWHDALMAAVAVLIITCPCALGLAVPAVQVVASGILFRRGIMIKSGGALEKLAAVDTAVFDKTGTLTLGEPAMIGPAAVSADKLAVAAGLAQTSKHPLSKALAAAVAARGIEPAKIEDVTEHPGLGLDGRWRGKPVHLGSRAWCGLPDAADDEGFLEIALRVGDANPVIFGFEDQLRPEARETVNELAGDGLKIEMLSGDRKAAVARAAAETGITSYFSRMSPGAKLARVEELARAGAKVLVVGDGINDAPALAAGFTSMAPSSASDIGRTAADIVFMGSSLSTVAFARRIARGAQAIAKQNFALAIGYNLIAVPIAISGFATPLIAAVAMSSSSIIVIANALGLSLKRHGSRAAILEAAPALSSVPMRRAA
jgi:P-type Cu2+ transporter